MAGETSLNLSHDQFFTKLASLFDAARSANTHTSVFLTQKRLSHGTSAATSSSSWDDLADLNAEKPLPLIIRVSNGKLPKDRKEKVKLSTIVQPTDLDTFYARYAEVCKAGMGGLKKRDRRKAKKGKKGGKEGGAAVKA